jgi:Platelet-activating factor acetylhydrolase, isoform II
VKATVVVASEWNFWNILARDTVVASMPVVQPAAKPLERVIRRRKPNRVAVLALAATCQFLQAQLPADGQTTIAAPATLPHPTGPFAVGRVTVHWADRSRIELTPNGGARELMVDVWYPAESASAPVAEYLDRSAFDQPRSAERLKGYLRTAYDAIKAGLVRTHAIEGAPFAHSAKRSPVLVFSHGGGEARETYTAQLEDLASHGYVAAAITHTYEAVLAIFPGGRHVVLTPKRWPPPMASAIEGLPPSQEANPDRLRWWADDIRFVLDELTRENRNGSSLLPFAGRLDLARVGAFGHSAGGQAAAHACQIDRRLRACLNQDGLSGFAPYYLDTLGWGMDQAFLLIERAPKTDPPTDKELAAMKMTRSQAYELLAKLKARHDATLRNTGKASYRVVFENKKTTHADFTDLPLLQSRDDAEAETRARLLGVVRNYNRAFFDKNLKGMKSTLLDGNAVSEFVEAVEKFEPAKRPRRGR